jgi:SPP1 gp7 family putative phage head morphogenesis protein
VARVIRNRVDGVMMSRSLALTRTELMRAYRGSLFDQYGAMGFTQWQWSAAMSTRTCLACISRSGKVYSMDNPFMPAHVNCRCSPVPVHPAATAMYSGG